MIRKQGGAAMYNLNASSDILHMKFIIALKTAVRLITLV